MVVLYDNSSECDAQVWRKSGSSICFISKALAYTVFLVASQTGEKHFELPSNISCMDVKIHYVGSCLILKKNA